ncbi:MAG: PHP domain-containing protein [Pseudomonadota bacterium]
MNDSVDLHLHSTHSDGVLSPAALVELLVANGVRQFALTDHDTVAGLGEVARCAQGAGLHCITGTELSASWLGRTIHVVGLGFDPDCAPIATAVDTRLALRRERARTIAARLDRGGAPGSAALERLAGTAVPTRTHFARALAELGAARDAAHAFDRWLGHGKPGHVPSEWPALEETVAAIVAGGGTAVLAHPLRYRLSAGQRRTLVRVFAAAGGGALEVVTGGVAPHQIETALGLALRGGLAGSVGSDCHDPALPWHRPGRLAKLPAAVVPVWDRWAAAPTRALEA